MFRLFRRGVDHGCFACSRPGSLDLSTAEFLSGASAKWQRDEPIWLPNAVRADARAQRDAIRATHAMFGRLRRGASFQDEVWTRLGPRAAFQPAGATIDVGDTREIEKVFANARRSRRTVARELYAKLSWIAHDETDQSLRIRFSFGSEALLDWQSETRRAPWADAFASAVFPESAAITGNAPLVALIERLAGCRVRLSERIIYSNAPGGGATFHHDAEPHQLGVVYSQLAGETAWLALPKRALAGHVAAAARSRELRRLVSTPRRALRLLDDEANPALGKLLNATPSFTRRLASHRALLHLRAGNALLLPSHGPDDVCWHSVFALGARASLAHSYGIFALRR